MLCVVCNKGLAFCTCPDIDERLRKIRESPYVVMVWCDACDRHLDRCICGSKRPN